MSFVRSFVFTNDSDLTGESLILKLFRLFLKYFKTIKVTSGKQRFPQPETSDCIRTICLAPSIGDSEKMGITADGNYYLIVATTTIV